MMGYRATPISISFNNHFQYQTVHGFLLLQQLISTSRHNKKENPPVHLKKDVFWSSTSTREVFSHTDSSGLIKRKVIMGLLAALMASLLIFTYLATSQAGRANIEAENARLHKAAVDKNNQHWDKLEQRYTVFDEFEPERNEVPHYMQGYWLNDRPIDDILIHIDQSTLTKYRWEYGRCFRKTYGPLDLLYNSEIERVSNHGQGGMGSVYKDRMHTELRGRNLRYHFTVRDDQTLKTEEIYREGTLSTADYKKLSMFDMDDTEFCER